MFLADKERTFLEAVSNLAYSNPFLPERMEHERAALGPAVFEDEPLWSLAVEDPERRRVNIPRIVERLEPLIEQLLARIRNGANLNARERALYEDGVLQLLYQRHYQAFYDASFSAALQSRTRWRFYQEFLHNWGRFFDTGAALDPRHIFACFRQIQRAFDAIFRDIIGGSLPAARLRASIWQSVFTHDMRRYRRTLYARMGEFATLITGPSGTGKELAARAIAFSRYAPFDDHTFTFAEEHDDLFYPINISALSPTLVESELFGHLRGSFTGAIADRKGWLETCPDLGSVFLDELGDLDPGIQVKLLRVIETRSFHPVGGTASKQFRGKLIAATHRDLAARMRRGEFREDLYYRLCSDQIVTPPLAEQVADSPQVLPDLVLYMSRRIAGEEGESLARDVTEWIDANLGRAYTWPGNYRELEQCVKNVLIRRDYRPAGAARAEPLEEVADAIRTGRLTLDEVLTRYVTVVYSTTQSYEETARRLGIDRRTAKAKVDRALLSRLRNDVH